MSIATPSVRQPHHFDEANEEIVRLILEQVSYTESEDRLGLTPLLLALWRLASQDAWLLELLTRGNLPA